MVDWFSFSDSPSMVYLSYNLTSEHTHEEWKKMIDGRVGTLSGGEVALFIKGLGAGPLLHALGQKCLWASVIPAGYLFAVLRRKRVLWGLVSILPLLLSVGVLLVGPTSLWSEGIRYVFPLACVAPVFVAVAIRGLGSDTPNEDG